MPLLDIRNLTIEFKTGDEWVKSAVLLVNPVPARV